MMFDEILKIDRVLDLAGGVFWALTYVLVIRRGYLDRTYGMPLVALCANVSWEFIFSLYPHPSSDPAYRAVHLLWFFLDLIIVYQLLKYGPREFARLSKRTFYAMFGLALVTSFCTVLMLTWPLNDQYGYYSAFGSNLLMSVLFITMLYARRSLRGQSLSIALSKMLGTALYSLAYYVYFVYGKNRELTFDDSFLRNDIHLLVLYLSVAILVYDLIYVVMVWMQRRVEAKAEHQVTTG